MAQQKQQLSKSIGFPGFVALGFGCTFGASWLVMGSAWLDSSGGILNAILAILLCLIIELPLAFAYLEAVPMIPLAGGETAYSYLAYGSFAGMIAGWFGVLCNLLLAAWEACALTRMFGFLFPAIKTTIPLYNVGETVVTLPGIIISLALVIGVGILQYKGVKLSSKLQIIVSSTVIGLLVISIFAGFPHFNLANLQPTSVKPVLIGVPALLAMLPFSIAGWENVVKGAEEANAGLDRAKIGKALVISVVAGTFMYMVTAVAPALLMPWQSLTGVDIAFATAINQAMGTPLFGTVLTVAACVGVVGVYNGALFGTTRLLYFLGEVGLFPAAFTKLHPKYNTPVVAIVFASLLVGIAPFVGRAAIIPLVDVSAFAYIVLWGSTLLSVIKLRKSHPHLERPAKMPGGKPVMYFGIVCALVLAGLMLIPGSPAALKWPTEYILLVALVIIGGVLYARRDKRMTEEEQAKKILGDIAQNAKEEERTQIA